MRLYALPTGTRQNFDGERHEANRIFTGIPGGMSPAKNPASFLFAVHILPQPPAVCGKNDISRESAELAAFMLEKRRRLTCPEKRAKQKGSIFPQKAFTINFHPGCCCGYLFPSHSAGRNRSRKQDSGCP